MQLGLQKLLTLSHRQSELAEQEDDVLKAYLHCSLHEEAALSNQQKVG